MPTIKLDEGKSVRVEEPKHATNVALDDSNVLPEEITKTRRRFAIFFHLITLVIISMFVARVPFIGSYPDSYIFEFIFGNLKYAVYAIVITWLIFKLFRFKIVRIFKTKRFILGTILCMIGLILTLAIAQKYLLVNSDVNLETYMTGFTNWANSKDAQVYNPFMPTIWAGRPYLDAGIIGTLLVVAWQYVAAVLLSIVALLLITIGVIIFINRRNNKAVALVKKWLINLLGGSVYKNSYDELSGDKNDTKPVIHKNIEIQQEADKLEQLTPPISFLTDTGIDNYFENKSRAEKYQQTLTKFIRKLSLDAAYRDTVIMPQYTEINFEVASKSQIDDILKAQSELLHVLQVEAFNISFKGNIVMFEIPNKKVSKISMRQIFNSMASIQNDEAIAGMGFDNAPLLIDINKHSNMMIIGRRGSGAAMLLTTMLISLAYLNSPKSLEMTILSPLGDRSLKYFDSLPHMQYPLITDLEECLIKLHDLLKQIEERETKFKDAGAKTLEEFNKYQSTESSRFKTSILAISSFDHLLKNSLQNIQLLHEILTRGPSVGIRTILLSINVNNETIEPKIFDVISARFILRLESEHESLKLFDNYRGIQLSGNGDGYYFDVKSNKKNRFQTCYLNVNELMETIKIIKTFYSTKDRSN